MCALVGPIWRPVPSAGLVCWVSWRSCGGGSVWKMRIWPSRCPLEETSPPCCNSRTTARCVMSPQAMFLPHFTRFRGKILLMDNLTGKLIFRHNISLNDLFLWIYFTFILIQDEKGVHNEAIAPHVIFNITSSLENILLQSIILRDANFSYSCILKQHIFCFTVLTLCRYKITKML